MATRLSFQVSGGWSQLILVSEGDCDLGTLEKKQDSSQRNACVEHKVTQDGKIVKQQP